jgi:hypothetical protein
MRETQERSKAGSSRRCPILLHGELLSPWPGEISPKSSLFTSAQRLQRGLRKQSAWRENLSAEGVSQQLVEARGCAGEQNQVNTLDVGA